MTRLGKLRNTASLNGPRSIIFWRSWFASIVVGLLVFVSLNRSRRDLDSDFLLATAGASSSNEDGTRISSAENRQLSLQRRKHAQVPEEVYFLNGTDLSPKDGFSASWLQTREDFLTMPFDAIHTCEQAAFRAYEGSRIGKMRMTLDWMQFSVEHMSKWWKILDWDQHPIAQQTIMTKFKNYLKGASNFSVVNTLQNTIAVLAFQSYRSAINPQAAHELTAYSLAATIESLRRAGFGRCVVAVLVPQDIPMVEDAFQYLADQVEQNRKPHGGITKIGHLEVGYAYSSNAYIATKDSLKNMPRATIMTLRDAFLHAATDPALRTEQMNSNITAWLGTSQKQFDYVYLSEPDTILQTRAGALPALKAEVDKGNVLLPHRWQPIPHESDIRGLDKHAAQFLWEEEFEEVLELDPIHNHDACCDENKGKDFKPGMPPYHAWCGRYRFWYSCGFLKHNREDPQRHARLKDYKLLRILGGMELTTIAGNEHARRCMPRKQGVCRPDDFYEDFIPPNPFKKFGPRETAPPYSKQQRQQQS